MSEITEKTRPAKLSGRAAVLEQMGDHPAVRALMAWKPEALVDALWDRG
jgi:hypothetical protein